MVTPDNNAKPRSSLDCNYFFSTHRLNEQSPDRSQDTPDFVEKTRRVNPQRLAARLGPEIVAEMEALIYPGAKMPTFEVRRVIQERYSVDRRHIYDYFHSRGLRVAKEDKHTNLTRGRLSKTQQSRSETHTIDAGVTETPSKDVKSKEGSDLATNQPSTVWTTPQQHFPAKPIVPTETTDHTFFRSAKRVASERISGLKQKRRNQVLSGNKSPYAAGDYPSAKKRRSANPSPVLLLTDLDVGSCARTPSPCPEFTMCEDSPNHHDIGSPALTFSSSSESILELWDIASDLDHNTSLKDYKRDTLVTVEKHGPLTLKERVELYNLINDNIGGACGIEEYVGSYRAYMEEQSQHYFDRTLPRPAKSHAVVQSINNQLNNDVEVDFQQWLSVPAQPDQLLSQTSLVHPKEYLDSHFDIFSQLSDIHLYIKEMSGNDRLKDTMQPTSIDISSNAAATSYTGLQYKCHPFTVPLLDERNQAVVTTSSLARAQLETSFASSTVSDWNSTHNILATSGLAPISKNVHQNFPVEQHALKSSLQIPRPSRMRTTSAGGGI